MLIFNGNNSPEFYAGLNADGCLVSGLLKE